MQAKGQLINGDLELPLPRTDKYYYLEICIDPVPKARPRGRALKAKGSDKHYVHMYTPTTSGLFESELRLAALDSNVLFIESGPIGIAIFFYIERPKYLQSKKSPDGVIWHTKKPDIDNLSKSVLDSLKGVSWVDDNQVSFHGSWKLYSGKSEQSKIIIYMWPMSGSIVSDRPNHNQLVLDTAQELKKLIKKHASEEHRKSVKKMAKKKRRKK